MPNTPPPPTPQQGYEAELWAMADALRGSMHAAEYKHVVLGLIFLKYISDAFEERHKSVLAEEGPEAAEDRDEYTAENIFVLGRVYEYFLPRFASDEGKRGGEFYTPRCIVRLLVEMLKPYRDRVYDPCCGSSGMFVQSIEFIRAHATGNGNGGNRSGGDKLRDRRGQVLFIDASKLGRMADRTHRELTKQRRALRRQDKASGCKLREQQAEGARLDQALNANLKSLGIGRN